MPYIAAPGGTYDLSAFSCYYPQQDDNAATWGVYGSQVDYSNPVQLASGYADKRTAQVALEQMLSGDSQVRQLAPPPP